MVPLAEDPEQGVSFSRFLRLALLAVVIFAFLHWFVFESISVASGSMEPTLPVGTHAVLDKVTLRFRPPRRGDIVSFRSPVGKAGEYLKRVIALPGDTVELRSKKVVLNGVEQTEPYVKHTRPDERLAGDTMGPVTMPKDCLFVLGDNRDESDDSSVWVDEENRPAPCLPSKNVVGIVRGFF
jgi:signal peptidase I